MSNQPFSNDRPVHDPYAAAPQPLTPTEERTWATIGHVVPLAATVLSAGTLGFVGSLVVYLLYKDRGPFVRAHTANSVSYTHLTLPTNREV